MNLWIHRRNSKLRPGPNDAVKSCGHQHAVYFLFDATSPMNHLRWIALCRPCFVAHGHEPEIAVGIEVEATA
jgi:hypothetical protein